MDKGLDGGIRSLLWADRGFWALLGVLAGSYLVLILAMLGADAWWLATESDFGSISPERRGELIAAVKLTLITCTIAAFISLLIGVPCGYLLSRVRFPGRAFVEAVIDIPFVLPPLVVGLSLLLLLRLKIPALGIDLTGLLYNVPAIIIAMVAVAAAMAVRTMRTTFDFLPARPEAVAMVLGCSRAEAFTRVTLPMARRGMVTAYTLAWAKSMGEFGPITVVAGTIAGRTEVMSTSVFAAISVGELNAALAISLLMILIAGAVMLAVRLIGDGTGAVHERG